jgi:hypothetical protein
MVGATGPPLSLTSGEGAAVLDRPTCNTIMKDIRSWLAKD